MNMQGIQEQLIRHEGLRLKPYRCTAGKLTIGVGRNLDDKGISKEEALHLLNNDTTESFRKLTCIFPDQFRGWPDKFQRVLTDMHFQLGDAGFRKFKKMIRAVKAEDRVEMIRQMRDSRWYRQTTNRAEDLIGMVGTWQT